MSVRFFSVLLSFAAQVILLSGCSSFTQPETQTFQTNVNIEVKDPIVRKITNVTEKVEIHASGTFAPGMYSMHGVNVRAKPNTDFEFSFTLPISDPGHLSLSDATGKLTTSNALVINGFDAPQTITLNKGTIAGDIDLVRTISAFFFNMLDEQSVDTAGGAEASRAFAKITIDKAVFSIKPDSEMDLDRQHLHFGTHSKVEFRDLVVDQNLGYDGRCIVTANLADGCIYNGTKLDIGFEEAHGTIKFDAHRRNKVVTLTSVPDQSSIPLSTCLYRFGKNKVSSVRAQKVDLRVKNFSWNKAEGTDKAIVHFSSDLVINSANLEMHTNTIDLNVSFPKGVPATLAVDRDEQEINTTFSTAKSTPSDRADLNFHRPSASLLLSLHDATVGPISVSKSGELNLSLAEGTTARLDSVEWRSEKRNIVLNTDGRSILKIPDGKSMDLTKDQENTSFKLPLNISVGSASLIGSRLRLKLDRLNGKLIIDVAKEISFDGDLNLSIAESNILGRDHLDVQAQGLSINSAKGQSSIGLKNCAITIPASLLIDRICEHLPQDKVYEFNKTVMAERKWRYKNAIVNNLELRNATLSELDVKSGDQANFTASGDLTAEGTIEKTKLGSMMKTDDGQASWQTRPWQATGTINGQGVVHYKLIPKDSLANSEIQYQVDMEMPLPDDIDLDWSQVSNDLLEGAERSAIIKSIKSISKPIPIKFSGKFKLFPKGNEQLKALSIKELKTNPSVADNSIKISFSANANF